MLFCTVKLIKTDIRFSTMGVDGLWVWLRQITPSLVVSIKAVLKELIIISTLFRKGLGLLIVKLCTFNHYSRQ